MELSELNAALEEATRLVEDFWQNDDVVPVIYRRDESREINSLVWGMMRAISTGIGMKAHWDREQRTI